MSSLSASFFQYWPRPRSIWKLTRVYWPAAASASCAFMLPIGTPPNAIVFSSGVLSMGDMAKKGFLLNLIGVVMMTIATVVYLVPHLDLQTDSLPEWATPEAVENGQ